MGIPKIHGISEKVYQADPEGINEHVKRSAGFYVLYVCCTDNVPV